MNSGISFLLLRKGIIDLRFIITFSIHQMVCFIMTGMTNGKTPVYSVGDLWLTKMDQHGNILWEKIIGGAKYDSTYSVQATSDGGYIVSGMTGSFGSVMGLTHG